jgi:type VI secretion system secreted protein VgrG
MPKRLLNETELALARLVFGESLPYDRTFVSESSTWTNAIDDLGLALRGQKRPPEVNNAITLWDTSHFPIPLKTSKGDIESGNVFHMAWLIHELTHQWQYRRLGWTYVLRALGVQLRYGRDGYKYSLEGKTRLMDFNLEQQGDIARDYYFALAHQTNPAVRRLGVPLPVPLNWLEPFAAEFKQGVYREA